MYKVKNYLSPEYISELFSKSNTRYDLRNADFNIPKIQYSEVWQTLT